MLRDDYKKHGKMLEALDWKDGAGAEKMVRQMLNGKLPQFAKSAGKKSLGAEPSKPATTAKPSPPPQESRMSTPDKRPRSSGSLQDTGFWD